MRHYLFIYLFACLFGFPKSYSYALIRITFVCLFVCLKLHVTVNFQSWHQVAKHIFFSFNFSYLSLNKSFLSFIFFFLYNFHTADCSSYVSIVKMTYLLIHSFVHLKLNIIINVQLSHWVIQAIVLLSFFKPDALWSCTDHNSVCLFIHSFIPIFQSDIYVTRWDNWSDSPTACSSHGYSRGRYPLYLRGDGVPFTRLFRGAANWTGPCKITHMSNGLGSHLQP